MSKSEVIKITPNLAEDRNTGLKCQLCLTEFKNISNLEFHLLKHHGLRRETSPNVIKQFYCPDRDCMYNVEQEKPKYFTSLKYVKQHYLKVHKARTIKCGTSGCEKLFPTVALKESHEKICGKKFTCNVCNWEYSSREALLTHFRRKNHQNVIKENKVSEELKFVNKLPKLRPKPIIQLLINYNNNITTFNQSVQTEAIQIIDVVADKKNFKRQHQSQTTQTNAAVTNSNKKKLRSNTETQTLNATPKNIENILSDTYHIVDTPVTEGVNPNTDTEVTKIEQQQLHLHLDNQQLGDTLINNSSQTDDISQQQSKKEHYNNYFDDSLSCFGINQFDVNGLCTIETQTDLNQLLCDGNDNDSVHSDPMLYSHMYTQTCDDILSELGLGLTDIQTQTNWTTDYNDDFLVSTETQTSFSQCFLNDDNNNTGNTSNNCNTNSSIQTQTSQSMEYLADIANYSSIQTQT